MHLAILTGTNSVATVHVEFSLLPNYYGLVDPFHMSLADPFHMYSVATYCPILQASFTTVHFLREGGVLSG